jgi:proline iminopeptidase
MLTLFPPIKPYAEKSLAVDKPHVLHIEECGNPNGIPVLFLHGGPGGGTNPDQRRFFDPEHYRIILYDQRGCGKSTPHAELEKNTTHYLVNDIEAIRKLLKVKQWVLFGGSWGSTLSLVYAQTHPETVLGLILLGIFLCHDHDMNWLFQNGTNRIFPEYWEEFSNHIPAEEREDLLAAYYNRLTGTDEVARMSAAKVWSSWEANCASLQPHASIIEHMTEPHTALSLARLECHYCINQCFLEPNQILNNLPLIQHLPATIIHGRYDILCPVENAYLLHKSWPNSELNIIRDAGHASSEPGITDALIHATKNMALRFN